MKKSLEEIKQRRYQLLGFLNTLPNKTDNVDHLAEHFHVSPMTIRRDLTVLSKMGTITRHHGYATLNEKPHFEGPTNNDCLERIKQMLGQQAAKYVEANMTLFLNTSATALLAMDYLTELPLTVITNNLRISQKAVNSESTFILLGGEIRFPKEALVGDLTVESLSHINADVLIMGCSGFSAERGLSTGNIHEAKVNRLMIQNTKQTVICVADYRKIGINANFLVTDCKHIDLLITDIYSDPNAIKEIEALGVQVIQIDPTP